MRLHDALADREAQTGAPPGPGLGAEPDWDYIRANTVEGSDQTLEWAR